MWRLLKRLLLGLAAGVLLIAGFAVGVYFYIEHQTFHPVRTAPTPVNYRDPQTLLDEANRLAWLFNWPKAGPLYVRAEELFRERGNRRNEIYARVGRIRAQSETMSWVDVSEMLAQQLELPVVKSDPKLRLWCLAAKGYTDLEINPASAKRAWTESQRIARTPREEQWEARARGELGILSIEVLTKPGTLNR